MKRPRKEKPTQKYQEKKNAEAATNNAFTPAESDEKKGPLTFGCGTRTDGRTDKREKNKSHTAREMGDKECMW